MNVSGFKGWRASHGVADSVQPCRHLRKAAVILPAGILALAALLRLRVGPDHDASEAFAFGHYVLEQVGRQGLTLRREAGVVGPETIIAVDEAEAQEHIRSVATHVFHCTPVILGDVVIVYTDGKLRIVVALDRHLVLLATGVLPQELRVGAATWAGSVEVRRLGRLRDVNAAILERFAQQAEEGDTFATRKVLRHFVIQVNAIYGSAIELCQLVR
mmetsp:Transcript_14230/g.33939  ORF Transcript_14230/g.33939 Transcript_14230/m.33939 type:complete len:216 (+) Transcript_14230:143-790(+)